ncbi:MAG: M23 family metallopeptidase [Chloroflexota bacterium]
MKHKPIALFFSTIATLTALLVGGSRVAQSEAVLIADRFDYPLDPAQYGLESGSDFLDFTALGWHTGEDWNRHNTECDEDLGDPVYAVADGTITAAGLYDDPAGNTILIIHSLPDGSTVWSMYTHLDEITRFSGDVVMGEPIGTMGKTGGRPCVHLHWEIRITDLPPDHLPSDWSRQQIQANYLDPSDFVASYNLSDRVTVSHWSFYRGRTTTFRNPGLYNLSSAFNDKLSSIALPAGWTVTVYRDRSGSGPSHTYAANDTDFANDLFSDGSPVDDQISSLLIASPVK